MVTPRPGVLWLTKGLGPGGAERLLVSCAQVADHSHFAYQAAYLLPWKDHLVAELAAVGVPAQCLHGPTVTNLGWADRLRRLIAGGGIDIVHAHSPYPAVVARAVVRSIPPARRPAVVYTEHNAWTGYSRLTRWLNAATYPLDDARLAVSPQALASMPVRWRRRTELLVHGVPLATLDARRADGSNRAAVRAGLGVDESTVLVVTIANLRHHKDYPNLLEAARIVAGVRRDVRFAAVGQGPLADQLRARATAMGIDGIFTFVGYRADALAWLEAADLFVLPSLDEGYPVALMEAMAMGVPVVATAVGGVIDAIRPSVDGVLVPPRDPGSLAAAISALAADENWRRRMSTAAAERARRYDIARAMARIEQIYASLLTRPGRHLQGLPGLYRAT